MEHNYTKREIDILLDGIKKHIDDAVVVPLLETKAQTQKTNGRVSKLEQWKSYTAGAVAVILIIGIPIVWRVYDATYENTTKLNGLSIK